MVVVQTVYYPSSFSVESGDTLWLNIPMPTITLKTLNIKLGTALTTDLTNYVVEPLTDEIKATMTLTVPFLISFIIC